jgi:O-acetylserine/cysteine efflux transporter
MTRRDYLAALAVVVIWGLNFVVMKVGLQGLSPSLLGALRFAAASLPFLLFVPWPRVPLRFVLAYGLAQGVGQFGFLFFALHLGMTAGMASVVMQTQAFFTLGLGALLLGERARPQQWLGVGLAALGLACIAVAHGEGSQQMTLIGFVLTLGAAFMWAASNIVARHASATAPGYDPKAFIVWSSLVPVLPFLGAALWIDGPETVGASLAGLSLGSLLSVLYLAWLATLLAYTLWTRLLQRHPVGRVAPFSLLVPVVGLWAAAAAFGEQPSPLQWLGSAGVLAGLLVHQFGALGLGAWRRWRTG